MLWLKKNWLFLMTIIVIIIWLVKIPNSNQEMNIETIVDINHSSLINCLDNAESDFRNQVAVACVDQYHENENCDVTGRGTLGATLYSNYFNEKNLCLRKYPPQPNPENASLQEKCLLAANADLQIKRKNGCLNFYHENTDCIVIGRGTFGAELYINYYMEQQLCIAINPTT